MIWKDLDWQRSLSNRVKQMKQIKVSRLKGLLAVHLCWNVCLSVSSSAAAAASLFHFTLVYLFILLSLSLSLSAQFTDVVVALHLFFRKLKIYFWPGSGASFSRPSWQQPLPRRRRQTFQTIWIVDCSPLVSTALQRHHDQQVVSVTTKDQISKSHCWSAPGI